MLIIEILLIISSLSIVICNQLDYDANCCSIMVGKQEILCTSVIKTEYCKPSPNDLAQVGQNPITYLHHTKNVAQQSMNVSWSQNVPASALLKGYVVQLKVRYRTVCYMITFSKAVSKGIQIVNANCLPFVGLSNDLSVCITVFPVAESSDDLSAALKRDLQNDDSDEWDYKLRVAYNAPKKILKATFRPELETYNSLLLCNRTSNWARNNEERKVWCHDVDYNQTDVYVSQDPLSDRYTLEMHRSVCKYAECYNSWSQNSVELNSSRYDDFEITNCVFDPYKWWNTSFLLEPEPNMVLHYKAIPFYLHSKTCSWQQFHVALFMLSGSEMCNNTSKKPVSCTHLYHNNLVVKFGDLSPGNYCVRITPKDPRCTDSIPACRTINSNVQEINGVVTSGPSSEPSITLPPPESMTTVIVIVVAIGCGAAAAAICVVLGIRRIRVRRCPDTDKDPPESEMSVDDVMNLVSKAPRKPRVLLLFCADDDRLTKIIQSFAKVLEHCFYVEVFLPNSVDSVCQRMECSEGEWIIDTLHESDKIIFVSSTQALEKAQGSFDKDCTSEELRCFRSFFHHIINDTELQFNYDRLYVVRFSFTPSEFVFNKVVPNRHYEIPSSLANLFAVMHSKLLEDVRICDSKSLDHYWRCNFKEYSTLLQEIHTEEKRRNAAHQRLSGHTPSLIRHSRSHASLSTNKEECRVFLTAGQEGSDSLSLKSQSTDGSPKVSKERSKTSMSSNDSGYPSSVNGAVTPCSHIQHLV